MKRTDAEIFGAELRGYLLARGVTREAVCQYAGIDAATLSRITTGRRAMAPLQLVRLGEAIATAATKRMNRT